MARDGHALRQRIDEGRFYVACLGQFKRGKSTLLNALLGRELLPTGVAPVTSVVTVLRHGPPRARVQQGDAGWTEVPVEALSRYVSEAGNPENRKGVTAVEVFSPSPLLAKGMCLVDTPGISSVRLGNTAETLAFVPHVDAAIVVLGADPPISADELALVRELVGQVGELLFVLSKADRVDDADRAEAVAFTRAVLREATGEAEPRLYEVSARERLRGEGPARDWPALVDRLAQLGEAAGADLVARALERGVDALCARLHRELAERREALVRPIEESEARLETLRRCAQDAERAAGELRFLLDAEQHAFRQRLEEEADRFVAGAWPSIEAALRDAVVAATQPRRRLRRHAMDRAQEIVEPGVQAWLERMVPWADQELTATTARFTGHARAFVDALVANGQLPAAAVPPAVVVDAGLYARSHFYFYTGMRFTEYSGGAWLLDCLRTDRAARGAVTAVALDYARRLLDANTRRVVVDLSQRLHESRRSVEAALRRSLHEIAGTAEQAVVAARAVRDRGEAAVQQELERLDGWSARLGMVEGAGSRPGSPCGRAP